jgi:uncharacterized protein YukE
MGSYDWAVRSAPPVPTELPPVHRPVRGGLDRILGEGVDWILRETGLLGALERVTGNGDALHAAAQAWLDRAIEVRNATARLRVGAVPLPEAWEGGASDAFGGFMGRFVADVDAMAAGLADTARILDQAGASAGVAEDLVTGIIVDAAEWAAAELAATVVADLFTLGLASVAGGIAESATMAVFVERAAKVSADLGATLEQLVRELDDLKNAREAIRAAQGFRKLKELKKARTTLQDLDLLGPASGKLISWADKAVGSGAGLPMGHLGLRGLGMDVARTVAEAGQSP